MTALSRSADKEELARSLGAHEFVNTRVAEGEKSPLDAVEKFDFMYVCLLACLCCAVCARVSCCQVLQCCTVAEEHHVCVSVTVPPA